MKPIRVWWAGYVTEAHHYPWQGAALIAALAELEGIQCVFDPGEVEDCRLLVCASSIKNHWHTTRKLRAVYGLPTVHYCWDIYPWQVAGGDPPTQERAEYWAEYLDELRTAKEIWIPSPSVASRVAEFVGANPTKVIETSVRTYRGVEPWDGGYVLDPLRSYPDPNRLIVPKACEELGLPCIRTDNAMPRDEFERTVAGARLIVSAPVEASTGGLTLLEGYALGKPVLLCDSPRNGAGHYFGSRAAYFRADDRDDLKMRLRALYDSSDPKDKDPKWLDVQRFTQHRWVCGSFAESVMARKIANRVRALCE